MHVDEDFIFFGLGFRCIFVDKGSGVLGFVKAYGFHVRSPTFFRRSVEAIAFFLTLLSLVT